MKRDNCTRAMFKRAADRLAAEGRIAPSVRTMPLRAFQREPGDIVISRTAPDGAPRSKEDALVVARRRSPRATYRGSDARHFVFSAGEP